MTEMVWLCLGCGHIAEATSRIQRVCVQHPPGERRVMLLMRSEDDALRVLAAVQPPANTAALFDALMSETTVEAVARAMPHAHLRAARIALRAAHAAVTAESAS